MKNLVATLIGFCVTLAIFAGGAFTAVFFVNAEPVSVHKIDMSAGSVWTSKAVSVNAATKDFERLPARSVPQQPGSEGLPQHESSPDSKPEPIDTGVTASVSTKGAPNSSINSAHAEWC